MGSIINILSDNQLIAYTTELVSKPGCRLKLKHSHWRVLIFVNENQVFTHGHWYLTVTLWIRF